MNIATLCDSSYITKGLAMRQSLIDLGVEYKIYWLCLDEETYQILDEKIKDPNIIIFSLAILEDLDENLREKPNPASKYGSQRDNYIWSLTPYFTNLVLREYIRLGELLTYVDSDIYFYKSPQLILDTMENKSVGIHTHRFSESARTRRKNLNDVGWYNVGVIVFRNDVEGLTVSNRWTWWTQNIEGNELYEKYGTCGDQNWISAFFLVTDTKNICIFDEDHNISHLAPWCTHLDEVKPVVFFHFSHFNCNLQENTWTDSNHGEWKPAKHSHIRPYYERYFETIKKMNQLCQS